MIITHNYYFHLSYEIAQRFSGDSRILATHRTSEHSRGFIIEMALRVERNRFLMVLVDIACIS